jgi:hypothetical protein
MELKRANGILIYQQHCNISKQEKLCLFMVFLDEKIMMIDGKMNQLDRIGTILAKLMLF